MDKRKFSLPPIGGSSLLVIFAVLCLTIFAILSLSTAAAGKRLSERAAESVAEYYAAELEAEKILAGLRRGEKADNVTEKDGVFYYAVPISETQDLFAAVEINGESFRKLRWQSVPTGTWQADDSLNIWSGEYEQEEKPT